MPSAGEAPAFVEAVLRMRARRLAAVRATGDEKPAGLAALGFRIGGERFALALDALAEVLPLANWTPVPGLPQHLLGVVNVRGDIRPVLDLHALLNLSAPETGRPAYSLFLRGAGREVGLRVDSVDRIVFVETAALTLPHESGNGLPQRFVAGITPDTLVLLDAQQILALDVLQDRSAEYRRV